MTEPRRRGRPARIDLDRIVAVAAATDPAALTMAGVAAELGVSTPALYRWVSDREALLDLVAAHVATRVLPDLVPGPDTWRTWLSEWAHRLRAEVGAVPGYAHRLLTGDHRDAGHAPVEAAALAAFAAAGADPASARQYWYSFSSAVLGWIITDSAGRFPGTGSEPMAFDVHLAVLLGGVEAAIAAADPSS
jgi:AcrR family transcriptional regulator